MAGFTTHGLNGGAARTAAGMSRRLAAADQDFLVVRIVFMGCADGAYAMTGCGLS